VTITPHLPVDELELRYRRARDPVERSHWQLIWLLTQGQTTRQVAAHTGSSATWIRTIVHR